MADFLSSYPTFKNLVALQAEEPDPLLDDADELPVSVPLFTHQLGPDEQWLKSAVLRLYEPRDPKPLTEIWSDVDIEPWPGLEFSGADVCLVAEVSSLFGAFDSPEQIPKFSAFCALCGNWSKYVEELEDVESAVSGWIRVIII
ncbi:MAG: hypothetical protein SGPRY_003436 [Prymnesium sp.]